MSSWPLPTALPDTPEIEQALQQLGGSYRRLSVNYGLAYRAFLDRCLDGKLAGNHVVRFWFHFRVFREDPAIGTEVEIIDDSDLTDEEEASWLECTESYHVGNQVDVFFPDANPEEDESAEVNTMHWAMTSMFPVEDSFIYRLIRSNGRVVTEPEAAR